MRKKLFLSILAVLFTAYVFVFLNGFTPTNAMGIFAMKITNTNLYHNPKIKLGHKYMQRLVSTKDGEDDVIDFLFSKQYTLTKQEGNVYTFRKYNNYMVLEKTEFLNDYYIWQSITTEEDSMRAILNLPLPEEEEILK